jgi:hypothetical protein
MSTEGRYTAFCSAVLLQLVWQLFMSLFLYFG